jgi:UDP-GlcNAc:undecaprenyl-phosphate GlcNAc-1-phosphate transferase
MFAATVVLPVSAHLQWKVIGIASCMFVLGFVDDLVHLRPAPKFMIQVLAAGLAVNCGLVYPVRESYVVNVTISIFWIVGITNAFNLLDNMDGLSAGIACISSLYLALFFVASGATVNALLPILLGGGVAGFLLFNFYPAKIFMGDGGSLFIGFLLACASLLGVTHISGVPALVFAPTVVLAIPIFDTLFVSVTRRLRGQPVSVGGTDHSSHRLVKLGLHERSAVLVLYALAAVSGSIALILRHIRYKYAIGLLALWFLFLLLFGLHLFRTGASNHSNRALRMFADLDRLALLLDPFVLSLAYYLGSFLIFGSVDPHEYSAFFFSTWPIVVAVKLGALYLWKVYRASWWRGSASSIYRLAGGVICGEMLIVLLALAHEIHVRSTIIFLLDGTFSWVLLLAIRRSFSFFRGILQTLESSRRGARRVLVLGTSEHTEAAIQFLKGQGIYCAGLVDTNGGVDLGRLVWGKRVVGHVTDLSGVAAEHQITEIILPENEMIPCSEAELQDCCVRQNLQLTKLGLYSVVVREDLPVLAQKAKSKGFGSL